MDEEHAGEAERIEALRAQRRELLGKLAALSERAGRVKVELLRKVTR